MNRSVDYERYVKEVNESTKKIIDVLSDMGLDYGQGQEVLRKALTYLERASLKNKIKSVRQENRL